MAVGVALMFNIVLPKNFDSPIARSASRISGGARTSPCRVPARLSLRPTRRPRGPASRASMAALLTTMVLGGCGTGHGGDSCCRPRRTAARWHWRCSGGAGSASAIVRQLVSHVRVRDAGLDPVPRAEPGQSDGDGKALAGVPRFFGQEGWRLIGAAAICAVLLPPSYRIAARLTRDPQPFTAILLALAGIAVLVQLGRTRSMSSSISSSDGCRARCGTARSWRRWLIVLVALAFGGAALLIWQ